MSSDMLSTVKMPAWRPARADTAATATTDRKAAPAETEPALPVTAETVRNAAGAIESYMKSAGRELEFRVDEASGQMVVNVRDVTTGDLIRQIPGEAALRMARQLNEKNADAMSLLDVKV